MNKQNKGLADAQDGQFILNESGTSVSIDSQDEKPVPDRELSNPPADKAVRKENDGLLGEPVLKDSAAEPKDNTD